MQQGLCHSDLSVINGSRPRSLPMVLGHEATGEVLKVGSSVTRVKEGDHVVCTFIQAVVNVYHVKKDVQLCVKMELKQMKRRNVRRRYSII